MLCSELASQCKTSKGASVCCLRTVYFYTSADGNGNVKLISFEGRGILNILLYSLGYFNISRSYYLFLVSDVMKCPWLQFYKKETKSFSFHTSVL